MQVTLVQMLSSNNLIQAPDVSSPFPLFQMSCIEEEIDCMNESFLQLSMQLQKRAQMSTWLKEREDSAGNHSAVISWNITHIRVYNYVIRGINVCGNLTVF